jgi:hypothetical protein
MAKKGSVRFIPPGDMRYITNDSRDSTYVFSEKSFSRSAKRSGLENELRLGIMEFVDKFPKGYEVFIRVKKVRNYGR